jgi:hypothetical protein
MNPSASTFFYAYNIYEVSLVNVKNGEQYTIALQYIVSVYQQMSSKTVGVYDVVRRSLEKFDPFTLSAAARSLMISYCWYTSTIFMINVDETENRFFRMIPPIIYPDIYRTAQSNI